MAQRILILSDKNIVTQMHKANEQQIMWVDCMDASLKPNSITLDGSKPAPN